MYVRKIFLTLVLLTVTVISGFALDNLDLRFFFESGVNFEGMDFYDEDGNMDAGDFSFSGVSPVMGGLTAEVVFDNTGVGWTLLMNSGKFNDEKIVDFDTRFYMTHHLFGTQRLFDLWFEAGIGFAGSVDIEKARDDDDDDDDWEDCDDSDYDFLDMSVYSHLAVGFAVNPAKFLTIGTRLSWRPISGEIPSYGCLEYHETPMFQAGLFIGMSFNIDRKKNREIEAAEEAEEAAIEAAEENADAEAEAAELAREKADEALEELEVEVDGDAEAVESSSGQDINIHIENADEVNININTR